MPLSNYGRILIEDIEKLTDSAIAQEKTQKPSDDREFALAKLERVKRECQMILTIIK